MDLREALLATKAKFRIHKVELTAELQALVDGQEFYVRQMTAGERGVVENSRNVEYVDPAGKTRWHFDMTSDRERVLVRCLCDSGGKRLFADDDAALVGTLPGDLVDALYDAAKRNDGLDTRKLDKELEKNSTSQTASSP